ncbi:MAG TPA: zinc ribbon domain-containing protein [Pyrinomonadaceae bacterium]|nr:zinc ribbon domain-containing protein [Pyrinomonadaceae bacterium]
MFCPNCGANNTTEQKFCRSCGLNLEKTAESLVEQIPSAESARLLRREKLLERFGNFALGGLGAVILFAVAILIYYVIEKYLLGGTNIYFAVLAIGFIVFAFLSLIFVFFNETLKEKKAKINPALTNELTGKNETANLLEEKPFAPARSVTENTTGSLYVERKTKKFE